MDDGFRWPFGAQGRHAVCATILKNKIKMTRTPPFEITHALQSMAFCLALHEYTKCLVY